MNTKFTFLRLRLKYKSKNKSSQVYLLLAFLFQLITYGQDHQLWKEYQNSSNSKLTDWSASGYKSGNSAIPWRTATHSVIKYGARANDGKNDRAAVQKAIDAAAAAGGGVVYFPPGQYDFWVGPKGHTLRINSSNIVLRGAGQTKTTLLQHNFHQGPLNYKRYYLINIASPKGLDGISRNLIQNASRHATKIKVSSTDRISKGDVIMIQMLRVNNSTALHKELIFPLEPEKNWTSFNRFFPIEQMVTVKKVESDGQTLTLEQPLHTSYLRRHAARIVLINGRLIKNVGVENLELKGSWTNTYNHHGSFEDDYGWNAIGMHRVVNSWVRNITSNKMGTDIDMGNVGFCTIRNIKTIGYKGHSGIGLSHSYSNLVQNYTLFVLRTHTVGVSSSSSGNVFTNIKNNSNGAGSIDFHGAGPNNSNLFENSTNLRISSGGGTNNMPHAGHNNVFWNISAGPKTKYEDMFTYGLYSYSDYKGPNQNSDLHQLFPKSILVGITTGNNAIPIKVDGSRVKRNNNWYYVDAIEQNVTPRSVYREQVVTSSISKKEGATNPKSQLSSNTLGVFPNPLTQTDILSINIGAPFVENSKIEATLLDLTGKQIKSFKGLKPDSNQTIVLKKWNVAIEPGIYMLKIHIDQNSFVKKIVYHNF